MTATGLKLKLIGGVRLEVDGTPVDPGSRLLYKGAMLDGVPNFAVAIGYTNASWTLKCDLTSRFVSRLLNHMRRRGYRMAQPIAQPGMAADAPVLNLTSGYVQRAADLLPRQGARAPWKTRQNYLSDLMAFHMERLDDGILRFEAVRSTRERNAT